MPRAHDLKVAWPDSRRLRIVSASAPVKSAYESPRDAGFTLLTLDTVRGDAGEQLYAMGRMAAGRRDSRLRALSGRQTV